MSNQPDNPVELPVEVLPPSALEVMERAQIDMQIATAKKYPRVLSLVKKAMLEFATLDEDTAAACFYSVPREGKMIQGPSARLAEIALCCFQNVRAGARIIANDGKTITAQGVCHDLQNNVSVSVEVKRRITKKDGKVYSDDMQVTTGNAGCSIALRNAVFKVVPMALVRPVYEAAKRVAIGDAKTLSSRREKCVASFAAMGVAKEKVLGKLGRRAVEDITLEDIEMLIGLHTALKEGDMGIEEAFAEQAKPIGRPMFETGHGTASPVAAKAPQSDSAPMAEPEGPGSPGTPTTPAPVAAGGNGFQPVKALRGLAGMGGIGDGLLLDYWVSTGKTDGSESSLEEVEISRPGLVAATVNEWSVVGPQLLAQKQKGTK